MSDPRDPNRYPRYDNGNFPIGGRQDRYPSSYLDWILVSVAVAIVLEVLIFGVGDHTRTITNPAPEVTSGQASRPLVVSTPGANSSSRNPTQAPATRSSTGP
jgi:hypothetical protein